MRVTVYPEPMSDEKTLEFIKHILKLNDCVNIKEFIDVAEAKNKQLRTRLDSAYARIEKLLSEGKTEPFKPSGKKESSPADHYGGRGGHWTGD